MPYLGLAVLAAAAGFFIDKTGEGVEAASNGFVKMAVIGVAGFLVLRKAKVI